MSLEQEVSDLRNDLASKMGLFTAARQELSRLQTVSLPAELAVERDDLITTADYIVSPLKDAWAKISEAWDYFFGDDSLGLAPFAIAAAVVAGGAALVLVTKFLADYATFRAKVALVKGGMTTTDVEKLAAPSPLFSLDSKLLVLGGLVVAGLALWYLKGKK